MNCACELDVCYSSYIYCMRLLVIFIVTTSVYIYLMQCCITAFYLSRENILDPM